MTHGQHDIETPAGMLEIIAAALAEHGVQVGRGSADHMAGGDGFVDVRTPAGQSVRIKVETSRGY